MTAKCHTKKLKVCAKEALSAENQRRFDEYVNTVSAIHPYTLHFFDESSVIKTTGNRLYGHATVGEKAIEELDRFGNYCLRPGDIVVMDNCGFYHGRFAENTLRFILGHRHVDLLYQPPYHPDLNTCEVCFKVMKDYLRKHTIYARELTDMAICDGLGQVTASKCHHAAGCIPLQSKSIETTFEGTYLEIVAFIVKSVTLLTFLLVVLRTCICLKYKVFSKKRYQNTDHTNTAHPNESGNNLQQVETHEYDEVDGGFLYRESSVNDEHDVRSSGSSTGGSGICGTDSDGYLNPFMCRNQLKLQYGQEPNSEQSSTETSFIHAQENTDGV
ncbi:unnamed protein product [Mytilus coruscus]|uniref:Tc1-like transposase DDE domain-containing protein n=1 Tax=Mytilus coruscus TaxID=42192 RepID=A0A6J8BCU3_MYTCO|nr:unnamed protein product [Mytilus coruscus]